MRSIPHRRHAAGKRKIRRRLDRPVTARPAGLHRLQHPLGYRNQDSGHRLRRHWRIQLLVRKLGLTEAIDERLHLLKFHFHYHESDHVLNFAYNALSNTTTLAGY